MEDLDRTHEGSKVIPIDVLDKFLRMSKDSNEAYGALVSAIDTMSAKIMDMEDRILGWEQAVQNEDLGTLMRDCISKIKEDVEALKLVITSLDNESLRTVVSAMPKAKYNLLKSLEDCLSFDNRSEQEVKELSRSLIWFSQLISYIRNNIIFYAFVCGLVLAVILLSSGVSLWDTVKMFLKSY